MAWSVLSRLLKNETHSENRGKTIDLFWLEGGEPRDLVGLCIFLASAASDFITGQIIYLDGGLTAVG